MSSEIAIKIENLSKCYHIYEKPRDRLLQMIMRGSRQYYKEHWATKDVSFEIVKGETVGIVGRNGSGKSTILQMICGTLNQTSGQIHADGRIAALLELGSGFNPEFTGRENVYMNSAILGVSQSETEKRYQEIIDFSGIAEFIDQPVKTYSSGMLVRLAFSVAINTNPQILVVDEALAVGDELFQRRCFSKLDQLKKGGTTILFVSHAGSTIVELCDRAILIDKGELLSIGLPKKIVGQYQKLLYAPEDQHKVLREKIKEEYASIKSTSIDSTKMRREVSDRQELSTSNDFEEDELFDPNLKPSSTIEYQSHGAKISEPMILTEGGRQVNILKQGKTYRYTYRVRFERPCAGVRFGMLIKTVTGFEIGGSASAILENAIPYVEDESTFTIEFKFQCNLNAGTYFMNAGVVGSQSDSETYLHRLLDATIFKVFPSPQRLTTGIVDFNCKPKIIAN